MSSIVNDLSFLVTANKNPELLMFEKPSESGEFSPYGNSPKIPQDKKRWSGYSEPNWRGYEIRACTGLVMDEPIVPTHVTIHVASSTDPKKPFSISVTGTSRQDFRVIDFPAKSSIEALAGQTLKALKCLRELGKSPIKDYVSFEHNERFLASLGIPYETSFSDALLAQLEDFKKGSLPKEDESKSAATPSSPKKGGFHFFGKK
jgi:hypothetical protein